MQRFKFQFIVEYEVETEIGEDEELDISLIDKFLPQTEFAHPIGKPQKVYIFVKHGNQWHTVIPANDNQGVE